MSEEKTNKMPEKTKPEKANNKKAEVANNKSEKKFSFFIPLVLLIALFIVFAFVNNRLNKIEQKLDSSSVKNDSAVQDSIKRTTEALSSLSSLHKKLEELESKQEVMSHSLSQPQEQQIHINKDYALAEIEHLLIIASYNLQLGHDIATALSAMESADARLTGLSDSGVLSVREQLVADMNELRAINQADLSGLALYLSDLISRVDELVLKENLVSEKTKTKVEINKEETKGIKQFFMLVFKELKSLIVITRDNNVSKARLLPDEVYFIKANLRLELANARFAVFNRDKENLHASIGYIQLWLNNYFDMSDAAVKNIYDSLSKMKKMELAFPEMDISSSLESVRALIHYQDGNNSTVDEEELMPLQ
jgi:uroporphyrin-III C-methyltransferase